MSRLEKEPFYWAYMSNSSLIKRKVVSLEEKKEMFRNTINHLTNWQNQNSFFRDIKLTDMRRYHFFEDFQNFIYNLYTTTTGIQLTSLKQFIDNESICRLTSNCYTNMNILFNLELDVDKIASILRHIKVEGTKVRRKKPLVHTLTDIDDTVFVGGAGGTDSTYNKHIFYPGVSRFHKEINTTGLISYLSARPSLGVASFSEEKQKEKFNQYYRNKEMPYKAHMLLGNITGIYEGLFGKVEDLFAKKLDIFTSSLIPYVSSPESLANIINVKVLANICDMDVTDIERLIPKNMWTDTYKRFGLNKYISFCKFATIYPEYDFMFIGDSGQGDILAALLISKHPRNKACFIRDIIRKQRRHVIHGEDKDVWKLGLVNPSLKRELEMNNVFVFNNYIQAAMILNSIDPKLCSKTKVQKIAKSAQDEFFNIKDNRNIFKNIEWLANYKEKEIVRDFECAIYGKISDGLKDSTYSCSKLKIQK